MTIARSPYEVAADLVDPKPNPYRTDPVAWVSDKLGEYLWSKQREILEALVVHRKVAVRSCHEAGKDFTAARAVCWWIDTRTPNRAMSVTTAASGDQVKVILWKEINQAHKKGKLIGRTNLTEWYLNDEIVALGRKVADCTPTSFHGTHAPEGVLVVYDEACGVNEGLFQAGNSMAGNEPSRQLAIGNPDDPESYFAKLFQPDSGWHQIHIDGYETPNFTDENVPTEIKQSLLDHSYVNDLINEYGEESPIFTAKVRGNFPEDAKEGVVPWSKLSACKYVEPNHEGPHDLGVDVAGSEDGDATVIAERFGNEAILHDDWTIYSDDSQIIVGKVVEAIKATGAKRVKVDAIGVGFGVIGHLKALRKEGVHDAVILGVNVSHKSSNPDRFPNLRSQIWWEIARGFSVAGDWAMGGIDDKILSQLVSPRYSINARGQTVIEPKAETKKRTKRSPDHADAINLAFYEPVDRGPGRTSAKQMSSARIG